MNTASPGFWKSFGPGLLWAGASIGVSHLVQSTRAGATAGFGLALVILAAFVLKYPFFEYGARYAAATGRSLVSGYAAVGRWALWLYLLITVATALIVQSAVVVFTAYLVNLAFGVDWGLALTGGALIAVATALLVIGRYKYLDVSIKFVLALLAVSTVTASVVSVPRALNVPFDFLPDRSTVSLAFVIALVGWMPTALDLSVWSSLWTQAKDRSEGIRTSVRAARLDFNIGYVGTGVLAFAFMMLGATVMFGAGEAFSSSGTVFSAQLIDLYARLLGEWTRPIMIVAVLTTMISTSVTVVDGFPRALERTFLVLRDGPDDSAAPECGHYYWTVLAILAVLTVLVMALFVGSLTALVDFATTVSFTTAPLLGYITLRAITSNEVPVEHRPGRVMLGVSYLGIVLLAGTAIVYTVARFF